MELKLIVETGPHANLLFCQHEAGIYCIGRSPEADLALLSDGYVSREHCEIDFSIDGACLRDIGSRGGTFLAGQRIKEPVNLKDGDVIRVGRTTLRVTLSGVAIPTLTVESVFELQQRVSDTGPGEVWIARAQKLGQTVRLHRLPMNCPNREEKERFMRQAKICTLLQHPGITRFLDSNIEADFFWFTTELVEDEDVARFVARRGLPAQDEAMTLIQQMLDIVAYLHKMDVVHRSLQPESFCVRQQHGALNVLLTDLGSAKCFLECQPITHWGQRGFVIHAYTAPEALIEANDAKRCSDIYALGGILYFLLSGRAPYIPTVDKDVALTILDTDPTPLTELRSDLPPSLIAVVEKAMARDVAARYCNIAEMQTALFGSGDSGPTGIPPYLYQRLRETLMRCGPFESHSALAAVFVDARISQWRPDIPEAENRAARVERVLGWLYPLHNTRGENALVLFLYVLSARHAPADTCHNDLLTLTAELESLTCARRPLVHTR